MILIVDSLTGQGKRFAEKVGRYKIVDIKDVDTLNEPCFLITRSFGYGKVTDEAKQFLKNNHHWVKGLAVGGNKNWGENFGKAGDKISEKYNIPLVVKFEINGLPEEVKKVKEFIAEVENANT